MKTRILLFLCSVLAVQAALAQGNVNTKFGKPTKEELTMTTYAPEPGADAVILCRLTDVRYTVQQTGYLVDYQEKFRVKVLKPEGARYAKVVIPYYNNADKAGAKASKASLLTMTFLMGTTGMTAFDEQTGPMSESAAGDFSEESVEDVRATAYNVVNGKTVKTKLKASDVVREQIDDVHWQAIFTVPDVREGTVIEYEYNIHSELFYHLHDWYPQGEIPVAYACLTMEIPKYLIFNMEEHGIQRLECKCESGSMHYKVESDPLAAPRTVGTNRYTCIGRNFRGMPKDPYVWSTEDYCAGVTGELKSFSLMGSAATPYAMTWEQIDRMLLDDDDLGSQQDRHSPLRDELEAAKVTGISDMQQRAAAVFQIVTNRVKWNGKYEFWPQNTSQTLAAGTGSNADINMLLIQSLKDAGMKAFPVVLRERDKGLLPYNFPSLHKLSTFVVGIIVSDYMTAYVDASSVGGWLNVLPDNLLVEKARMLRKDKVYAWVNLQKLTRSQTTTVVEAVLGADGKLTGNQTTMYKGLAALRYRQQAGKTNEFAAEAKETTAFERQGVVSDGKISIVPFPTPPLTANPFTADTRLMPVEFPVDQSQQVVVNITLPEGYRLAEIPEKLSATTPDKGVTSKFLVTEGGNRIQVMYQMDVNKIVHADNNYNTLRGMYDMMAKNCTRQLEFVKR